MEWKRKKPHNKRKENKMNKTILVCLLFILLIVSSVQLVFADEQISVGFDPNPIQQPPYEPPSPPSNIPPVANITGPRIGYVNQSLIFSAHYSYDPDGILIEYRWDFENDGLFDTEWTKEILITHSYSNPGNYTIKLQAKDDNQATGVTQLIITIIRLTSPLQLPIAQANGPYQAYANQTITFHSNDSYDPDGIIMNYTWDFGDKTLSYEQNPVHIYTQPGNYIAILTVRDNDNLSNIALASVYIREYKETITPGTSQSAPPIIPFMSLILIFLIILFATLYNLLIKPTKNHILSTKQQKRSIIKNGIDEKFGNTSIEFKEKTGITKQISLKEKPMQKRHIYKPIGKSVFLNTDDEKLGDIIEIIRDQNNQIIGYKVKEDKSKKELHLFAEHCSQQKNNYIYTPDCFTIPSKVMKGFEVCDKINPDIILLLKDNVVSKDEWEKIYIQQDDELRKNINHPYALDKTIQGSLHILKKQHILIEDKLKELQRKKGKNVISQKQYLQMARPYHQMLEDINQNIKKYQNLTKRLKHTSSRKHNKRHK
jgi:hypothetical protein